MHIREYQEWLEAWDTARTWEKVTVSHTLLHAVEELGEISRLVQVVEGYRQRDDLGADELREELALELSDMQVMLFKIAYLCEIDMETAMKRGQEKAGLRFPNPADGPDEIDAYWRRYRAYLAEHDLPVYDTD